MNVLYHLGNKYLNYLLLRVTRSSERSASGKCFLILFFLAFSLSINAQNFPYPTPLARTQAGCATLPSEVINIVTMGADPTGNIDATQVFANALASDRSFVYVPNGKYKISNTIFWNPTSDPTSGIGGQGIQLWGESRDGVVLQLVDNAPGFSSKTSPKAVLNTGQFRPYRFGNAIHNITVNVGSGNPGAIGVQFYTNNLGGMYNSKVIAPAGSGYIGIDKGFARANGPDLLKDILVDGFDIGIETDYSVESEVFEYITLQNQKQIGFNNKKQVISIKDLTVINCGGPALVNESGHVAILNGIFSGTGAAAIINGTDGKLLARNITSTGYTLTIQDPDKPVTGSTIKEYVSNPVIGPGGVPFTGTTLNLPIEDAPFIPWDNPANWVNVEDYGATTLSICNVPNSPCNTCNDDAPTIQAAIDATLPGGPKAGARTLFLPGNYRLLSTVIIRGSIRRILGTGKQLGTSFLEVDQSGNPVGTNFIIERNTDANEPLEFQNIGGGRGSQVSYIENKSGRTLIFKNVGLGTLTLNGGKVFIESSNNGGNASLNLTNVDVWARQFNPEREGTKINMDGGSFWCLGLKTEGKGTIIEARNAAIELFGGFIYDTGSPETATMFRLENTQASLNFFEYVGRWGKPFLNILDDKIGVTNYVIPRGANAPGYAAPQPPQQPTFPATWSQRNDNTVFENGNWVYDNVVGTNMALYVNIAQTAPTEMLLSNADIGQGNAVGDAIGVLSSTDINAGTTFTYSLVSGTGSADNSAFTIAGSQLKAGIVFNYTTKQTYSIRVRTTDNSGLSLEKVFVINVKKFFSLPSSNFTVQASNETCAPNDDGKITITAVQALNYKATLTRNGTSTEYLFTTALEIPSLVTGIYSICITVQGRSNYQQCYDLTISEPQPLSIYSAVNMPAKLLELQLGGSDNYVVQLNGKTFATSGSTITLDLAKGANQLVVSTDKNCQGSFKKDFFVDDAIRIFPNPFDGTLTVALGNDTSPKAQISVSSISGEIVYSKQLNTENGFVQVDLQSLNIGMYIINIQTDLGTTSSKILKK